MLKSQNRYKLAVSLPEHEFRNVLDLGCGDGKLRDDLPKGIQYQGLDLREGKGIISHNLEKGIPFGDKSSDVIFALEVLEHLENIHFVFEEMLRVARNEMIISLPNMFHWSHRLRYFFGKIPMIKYTFYPQKQANIHLDRHRWLPSHESSVEFIKFNAKGRKTEVFYGIYPYKRFKFFGEIDSFLSRFFPNLFVYTSFFRVDLIDKYSKTQK